MYVYIMHIDFQLVQVGLVLSRRMLKLFIDHMKPLTITLWNIQGINSSSFGCKVKTLDFKKSVLDIDIIILQETWRRTDEVTLCPPGYREISISSQKHEKITRGRDSGGIIIWHKLEIDNYIQLIKKEESHIWLKLNN